MVLFLIKLNQEIFVSEQTHTALKQDCENKEIFSFNVEYFSGEGKLCWDISLTEFKGLTPETGKEAD